MHRPSPQICESPRTGVKTKVEGESALWEGFTELVRRAW